MPELAGDEAGLAGLGLAGATGVLSATTSVGAGFAAAVCMGTAGAGAGAGAGAAGAGDLTTNGDGLLMGWGTGLEAEATS